MAKPILPDDLWEKIKPLLPKKRRRRKYPGRRPLDDRKVLTGILFILRSGMPWEMLPKEMGCGSGMTCWNRLKEWHEAGVWEKLHRTLLNDLQAAGKLDWSRAIVDSASSRAPAGGEKTGPSPVDRRKLGSKHHIIVDADGVPLAMILTGANRHDMTQILPLVEAIPSVKGKRGRPRKRPHIVQGDRGYDSEPARRVLKKAASSHC